MKGFMGGDPPFELHRGNSLEVLKTMAEGSVDSIVTDPPYEIGFMGKGWDSSGIANSVELWAEALRVLKPGGHLLAFGGTRTFHRMACAIEDAGFELRDAVVSGHEATPGDCPWLMGWLFGSGFPKSKNLGGDWKGWGTALKPAWEPIVVARKPLTKGCTVTANVLAHGTGALNIDGCRVGSEAVISRHTAMLAHGGQNVRPWHDGHEATAHEHIGRWPANVIHDGSDEVLAAFPQAPGQQADASTDAEARKTQNVYGAMRRGRGDEASASSANQGDVGLRMRPGMRRLDKGSAARFFYCAKASRADRNEGCDSLPQRAGGMVSNTSGQHMTRRDEGYQPAPVSNHHPTVKPTELMRYLVRLVTPPGGTVLDVFMGSGSTGKAAMLEGFQFIGIDLDSDADGNPIGYVEIARARITHAWRQAEDTQRLQAEADRLAAEGPAQPDLFAAA